MTPSTADEASPTAGASRRRFLGALGAGALGVTAGFVSGHSAGAEDAARDALQARHVAGAADCGEQLARLGTHRVVWSVPTTGPVAALTFDDGPTPEYTPRVLDALADAGVQATFMLMGWNAVAHPGLVRDVLAAGHEIGNHTWSHEDLSTLDDVRTRQQISRCSAQVEDLTGRQVRAFRPPRGKITGYALRVAAELGMDTYIWSCTRGPGDSASVREIAGYMGRTVSAGDVLCLHDGLGRGTFQAGSAHAARLADRREREVRALPEALARIADRGVTLVGASRLLALADAERAVAAT